MEDKLTPSTTNAVILFSSPVGSGPPASNTTEEGTSKTMHVKTRRSFLQTLATSASTARAAIPAKPQAQTPTTPKYKVGILGHTNHGNYGHGIDTVWSAFPQIEVAALSDPDPTGRAAAAARTGAKRTYADYNEMLRTERPNIAAIGPRWLDQREAMITAAAEAGAHIYTEKPFARTPAEADRTCAAVRQNKIKLQIAHQMRISPYTQAARAMVEAGEIGALQEVRLRGKEDARAGGEDMMVLGSHLFDLARLFLGDPLWVTAHVTSNGEELAPQHARQPSEPLGLVAGNQIAATFAFPNGVHAYFASRASDQTHPLRFGTWLYGSKGVLFLPNGIYPGGGLYLLRSPAWLPDDRTPWQRVEAKPDLAAAGIRGDHEIANALMVADLLRAIETDAKPICSEDDGRWTVEMIHGVYQAQKAGNRVSFPLRSRNHSLEPEVL